MRASKISMDNPLKIYPSFYHHHRRKFLPNIGGFGDIGTWSILAKNREIA
jgi:hypothetical protein